MFAESDSSLPFLHPPQNQTKSAHLCPIPRKTSPKPHNPTSPKSDRNKPILSENGKGHSVPHHIPKIGQNQPILVRFRGNLPQNPQTRFLKIRQKQANPVRKRGRTLPPTSPHTTSPKSDRNKPILSENGERPLRPTPHPQNQTKSGQSCPKTGKNASAPHHSPKSDRIAPFLSENGRGGTARFAPRIIGRRRHRIARRPASPLRRWDGAVPECRGSYR